ncbi:hypothetical protein [Oligella urethralis]|uniref:hypothetical protein n=1 Tax=Oligella urethralis TaxID=90245 RepID=UPI000660F492|nr:hypothetical protein [Oligella urethralis]
MAWIFYYQSTPESEWKVSEVKYKAEVLKLQPPFITALELNQEVSEGMTREELSQVSYRGPLYFDFDSEDIAYVIPPFKKFLKSLEERGVSLEQCSLYATGGRGFHVTIPMEVFIPKVTGRGFKNLPAIYKEMAWDLAVDTMDMRVYSSRRGRMFRVSNVKRTNGKFKVPITASEARIMTPELYDDITSTSRGMIEPTTPEFNSSLGTLFTTCSEKVNRNRNRNRSKVDEELIARFNNEFPPTFLSIANGENLIKDVGFQMIATQLAITAVAFGKTEQELLEACKNLVANHQSDGHRYNTESKRYRELSRMYHYMLDNPCYEFSAGGLISLLDDKTLATDLEPEVEVPEGASLEGKDEDLGLDEETTKGVFFNKSGIFREKFDNKEERWKVTRISCVGIENITKVESINEGTRQFESQGFEFEAYVDGEFKGIGTIQDNAFNTSNMLHQTLGAKYSAGVDCTDSEARAMLDIFRRKSILGGNVVISLPREGLDVVEVPDKNSESGYSLLTMYVSAGKNGVIPKNKDYNFKFQGMWNPEGEFRVNLLKAKELEDTERIRKFYDDFFDLFPKEIMARVLGYFLACFLNQIFRYHFRKFPSMQIYGQAGSGKTEVASIVSQLHTYTNTIPILSAGSTTSFALRCYLEGSASVPVIFDEYKARELGPKRTNEFLQVARNNYTGNEGARGNIRSGSGSSTLFVDKNKNSAPLVFIGEQIEDQTAIIDRTILVNTNVGGAKNRKLTFAERSRFYRVKQGLNEGFLGMWGLLCVKAAISTPHEDFADTVNKYIVELSERCEGLASERPIYNNAVILTGLEFGMKVLETVFGGWYSPKFQSYINEILDNIETSIPINKSEATKVIETLAYLSKSKDIVISLEEYEDYIYCIDEATGKECVDLELRSCWDKYAKYRRAQGGELLFDSESSFITAMLEHETRIRGGSASNLGSSKYIVRLDLQMLYEEFQIDTFDFSGM